MTKGHVAWVSVLALGFLGLFPGTSLAQSGIAGVVRDTSGGVLPGVTVEAASPMLIEKVRTVVSGSDGTYRILDLRPGGYTVTFALAGFNTIRREGIDLPAAFTATVNAEMQVGSLEETITVSGAAPLVDVQNVTSQQQLSKELLESLPATRSAQGFLALQPGVVNNGGLGVIPGSVNEMGNSVHGSSANESIYAIDGMNTSTIQNAGGGSTFFRIAQAMVAEINVVTGGGTAEQPYSGLVSNVIPKEGGNSFSGSVYGEYSNTGLADTNLNDNLRAHGLTENGLISLTRLWDISPAFGGRILRDTLWFFGSYRNSGTIQTRAGVYENLTPLGWAYTPDLSRPAFAKLTQLNRNLRLTWQVTPRNKISVFADAAPQIAWNRNYQFAAFISPEATTYSPYLPNAFMTVQWKSPVTSRLLIDVNASHSAVDLNQRRHTPETCSCTAPAVGFDVIGVVDAVTNTEWRAATTFGRGQVYGHYANHDYRYAASASYITGSHAFKTGLQLVHGAEWFSQEPNGGVAFQFRNGVPASIAQYATPIRWEPAIRADLGLFVQDQWTVKRLTLTGGVRYDYMNAGATAQHLDAGLWVGARDFERTTDAPNWKNVSPRIAAAYDLFGDGKTAVKATLGRYVGSAGTNGGTIYLNNPVLRSVLSVTRTWADANGNFNPDCNLVSPLANGECGQINNLNFGQNNPNATTYDQETLQGRRSYNWETTALIQRQLRNGVSVTVGYYHREFANFLANDNQLVTPADFSQYCITVPADSRLPGGGGNQLCGLYDVSPALFGRNQTVVRNASHYGNQSQVYDGFDLTENIRLPSGATISGGLNWGRTKTNICFVVDSPGALQFCEVAPPFLPNASFVGFVPLPWWGLLTSATYRNYPGPQITATRQTTNAEIAPSLGRNLSSGVNGTANVELIQPGSVYAPRQQQVDFRISKRFRFGRNRLMANVDVFNVFNAAGTTTLNTTYGPNWQRPLLLQLGRFVKLSGQFDF